MNRINRPTYQGWAVVALCAAVLALGGCGRKAGLDLPPNGSSLSDTAVQTEAEKPSVFNPSFGADGAPVAAKGTKRGFVLDPLLNSN